MSKLLLALGCLSLSILFFGASTKTLLLNTTPSMPRGVWVRHAPYNKVSSTYVALTPPQQALELGCVRAHQVLIKHVWAREGEEVCVLDRKLYKKSTPAQVIKTNAFTRTGEPLRLGFSGCQVIPPEHVFVLGQHPSSCDSRIFGAVPIHTIQGEITPVLIWDDLKEQP